MTTSWHLDASSGRLLVHTDVAGRARRFGHRLTIEMTSWRARVDWSADEPAAVALDVDVDSLQVVAGEGGVTPLTGPEKAVARSNALKSLHADRYRTIRFISDDVAATGCGYRLDGTLEIHGTTVGHRIDVDVVDLGDRWRITADTGVRQSAVGVRPFSMLMGAMAVADRVRVGLTAEHPKDS